MSITIKKINDEKVKPIKYYGEGNDTREVKGYNLFSEIYANIFIASRKKSGKTVLIGDIIKKCSTKETVVIVFSSTINKDNTWKAIKNYCENHNIPFLSYTSLFDDGVNKLEELITELGENEIKTESESEDESNILDININRVKRKPKKPKYKAPEYIIVLDDLSTELKDRSVDAFCKKNRHYKAKFILSSQYWNDLSVGARKQQDYIILFKGMPDNKLQEIHRDGDLSLEFETFIKIYKYATKEKYSFLYVDTRNEEYRINFNRLIKLPEE